MCFGDYEEHAVLLCCFLKWMESQTQMGVRTYLCIGEAIPEGRTVYVMRMDIESQNLEFWNATTGQGYFIRRMDFQGSFCGIKFIKGARNVISSSDPDIPLKSIGCLVDETDIWINLQMADDPCRTVFDTNDPKL